MEEGNNATVYSAIIGIVVLFVRIIKQKMNIQSIYASMA